MKLHYNLVVLFALIWISSTGQQVNAEYFYNTDPGIGNGTPVSVSSVGGSYYEINANLPTTSMSGIKDLYLRILTNGKSSFVFHKKVAVIDNTPGAVSLEYFFDSDPGIGQGISVPSSSLGNGFFDISTALTASGLQGVHQLYIRGINGNNVSFVYTKAVLIVDNQAGALNLEYFFDEDPGIGQATPLTANSLGNGIYELSDIIPAAGLSGVHRLYLRGLTQNKASFTLSRDVFISDNQNNTVEIEYFFDEDPGVLQATKLATSAIGNGVYSLNSNINSQGKTGLHTLYLRPLLNNTPGQVLTKNVYIIPAQDTAASLHYYFDNDPGKPNWSTIALSPLSSGVYELNGSLATSNLDPGLHDLYVIPSAAQQGFRQRFRVFISDGKDIIASEYFLGADPGFGNGVSIPHAPDQRLALIDSIPLSGYGPGTVQLGFRSQNSAGTWGLTHWDSVCVSPEPKFVADTVCFGDTTMFVNTSSNADSSTLFSWAFGSQSSFISNQDTVILYHFSQAGFYEVSLAATQPDGCSDTLMRTVWVKAVDTVLVRDSICVGDTRLGFDSTGYYEVLFTNSVGCDSLVQLDLYVYPRDTSTQQFIACDVFTWDINNKTYSNSGIYLDTLQTVNGCDSVLVLDLTIYLSASTQLSVTNCDSYFWSQNGMTYTQSGMYYDTLQTINGCDSVLELDLTLYQSALTSLSMTSCNELTWAQNGMTYTQSGMYYDSLQTINGCDSILELDLTLYQSALTSLSVTSCGDFTWSQNGITYTQSGMYYDTLQTINGCDSVLELDLTLYQSALTSLSMTNCGDFTWSQNGMTYTQSGMYYDSLQTVNGCDSVLALDLTIHQSASTPLSMTSCNEFTWAQNGMTYTQSGMYYDTLQTVNGCDSVLMLDLTITPTPAISMDTTRNLWCNAISFTAIPDTGLSFYWSNGNTGAEWLVQAADGIFQTTQVVGNNGVCTSDTLTLSVNLADYTEYYNLIAGDYMLVKRANPFFGGNLGVTNTNGFARVDNFSGPKDINGFIQADSILSRNFTLFDTLFHSAAAIDLPVHNTATVIPLNFDTVRALPNQSKNARRRHHLIVEQNATMTLNSDVYGDLWVKRGATVIINSPVVQFTNIYMEISSTLADGPEIVFNQPTLVGVRNEMVLDKRAFFNPTEQDVTVYIGGGLDRKQFSFSRAAATINANVFVQGGRIEAVPGFSLRRTNLTGRFIADTAFINAIGINWFAPDCGGLAPAQQALQLENQLAEEVAPAQQQKDELPATGFGEFAQVKLYPNPSNGIINLELSGFEVPQADVFIADIAGKVLFSSKYSLCKDVCRYTLDLNHFPTGMYFLQLRNEQSIIQHKISKVE